MTSQMVSRGTGAVRSAVAVVAALAFLAIAPSAHASITSVFSNTAAPIPCAVQANSVRLCDQTIAGNPGGTSRSTIPTFDGVPIDVRVAFPPEPASGPDGPYPLMMLFHGYAGAKLSLASMQPFLDRGYATLSLTTRGFGQSCGTAAARTALGSACDSGYVRLMDTRYEVRDAQYLSGLLADDGKSSYTQIGAIGGSYGGGMSMALAALKDRQMLPDGSLVPWVSPISNTPMQLAAAAPEIPWTDLAASLTPNGSTLDYVDDAPYQGRSGVLKSSWENALYGSGLSFFYAPAGADPDADLRNWHTLFNAGEPYDDASGNPLPGIADIRDELTTHHSSYYINHSEQPAPMLISNGWTDDLFPVDEAVRFYNRTRGQYPNADISLFFASLGHQRGQNKSADLAVRSGLEFAWLDYYVKGVGSVPFHGVTAITETCPNSAPSGGPFTAGSYAALAPGEVRVTDGTPKTILPTAGSSAIAATFDPITGGGACATNSSADQADTATYRSDPVPSSGYTLMGSPTVIADITSPGSNSEVAARLLDVDPATSTQTLVARGLWRPAITSTPVRQVFQLHPNGYKFAAGHVVKLELLPKDSGTAAGNSYGRASNDQQNVTVENLELRLPTLEPPGSADGVVVAPAEKFVPEGYTLARDYQTGYARPKGASPFRVPLVPAFQQCTAPDNVHGAPLAFPSCSPPQQTSESATVGTPDSNGKRSNSLGNVVYSVITGNPNTGTDEADVAVKASITDVRKKSDLSDYEGDLQVQSIIRITDRKNSPSPGSDGDAATVVDFPFPVNMACATTALSTIGSTCSVSTTLDAVVPGAIAESKRSIWEFGQVQVFDGGDDGDVSTAPNTLFAVQGLFYP
jgi:predicted acyl esterase